MDNFAGSSFFGDMPIFMKLFFGIIFVVIVFTIIRAIAQSIKNVKSPVITVEAKVIGKRTNVSHHSSNSGVNNTTTNSTSTTYYITFETEHGERLELPLSGRMYGLLAEGDRGKLTYQGTWFKDFKRELN
ncbi:DUF2500 domain-containing protein [Clostridium manihotivorum]|nr:DUF2500 domain-containing protein [Clostridium manihotivorum]